MFAILTKLLWRLLQPSSLVAFGLLIAAWYAYRGRMPQTRRWLLGSLAAYLVMGYSSASNLLVAPLERRFTRPELSIVEPTGFILLGGAEDARIAAARQIIAVNDAAERYIETAILARRFPKARVVFTGGGEALTNAGETEAQSAARILLQIGLEPSRLMLEDRSRTTWENAIFTAPLIAQKPGERWLLVTSAWQMPRAMGAFRKAGLTVEAYPVDYRTTGAFNPFELHGSATDGLRLFDTVVREYPALLIYWLSGRSSALFPKP